MIIRALVGKPAAREIDYWEWLAPRMAKLRHLCRQNVGLGGLAIGLVCVCLADALGVVVGWAITGVIEGISLAVFSVIELVGGSHRLPLVERNKKKNL